MQAIKKFFMPYRVVLEYAVLFYLLSLWKGNHAALIIVGAVWAVMMTVWATALNDTAKQVTEFDPYYMRIWIKPYELLVDLGLMSEMDSKTWTTLSAQDPELQAKCERKHFTYYVLGPKLVHCSTEGQFAYFEVLNLHHKMTGVVVDWKSKLRPFEFLDGLDFFFQLAPGRRSYEFGVKLSVDWWNEHRVREGVSPDLKKLDARANGDLILGTIPIEIPFDDENGFEHRYLEISGRYLEQLNEPFHEMDYKVGYVHPTDRIKTA